MKFNFDCKGSDGRARGAISSMRLDSPTQFRGMVEGMRIRNHAMCLWIHEPNGWRRVGRLCRVLQFMPSPALKIIRSPQLCKKWAALSTTHLRHTWEGKGGEGQDRTAAAEWLPRWPQNVRKCFWELLGGKWGFPGQIGVATTGECLSVWGFWNRIWTILQRLMICEGKCWNPLN